MNEEIEDLVIAQERGELQSLNEDEEEVKRDIPDEVFDKAVATIGVQSLNRDTMDALENIGRYSDKFDDFSVARGILTLTRSDIFKTVQSLDNLLNNEDALSTGDKTRLFHIKAEFTRLLHDNAGQLIKVGSETKPPPKQDRNIPVPPPPGTVYTDNRTVHYYSNGEKKPEFDDSQKQ